MEIRAEHVPVKASGTQAAVVGRELVLLEGSGRILRGLNATGARVWELVDGTRSVGGIAAELAREWSLPRGRAEMDVARFLVALREKALITLRRAEGGSR